MRKTLLMVLTLATLSAFATAKQHYATNNHELPFGQNLTKVLKKLEAQCSTVTVHENLDLEVPTATVSQTQIDCMDYKPIQHSGLSEWVFADGLLDIVWVLSPIDELEATKQTLDKKGILPDYTLTGFADFYLDRGFGFRYQPSEFLYFIPPLL